MRHERDSTKDDNDCGATVAITEQFLYVVKNLVEHNYQLKLQLLCQCRNFVT